MHFSQLFLVIGLTKVYRFLLDNFSSTIYPSTIVKTIPYRFATARVINQFCLGLLSNRKMSDTPFWEVHHFEATYIFEQDYIYVQSDIRSVRMYCVINLFENSVYSQTVRGKKLIQSGAILSCLHLVSVTL